MVLLRGQKAEIRVINGAMAKTVIGIYGYLVQKTRTLMHPSLLESTPMTETKEFWGTRAAHLQTP